MGGWLGAIGSMFSWLGGEGIGASLARIAIGLGISKLLNKTNESAAGSNSSSTPQGTRQQIAAATDNKIPVAYGDSYFSGTVVDQRTINDNKETVVVLDLCELTGDIFSTNPTTPGSRTASDIIIDAIYLNNQIVTFKADGTTIDYTTDDTGVQDTNAQGLCGIYLYKGSSNAPMLPCTINTRTAIAGAVPPVAYQVMPGWDNSYTNQNKIFALVKMNYDPSKGLHALPEFKFHVRNTMNKVGDCLHDYMTNVMYGAGLPEGLVDNQSIIDLNAYGDELVTLGSYPAQPRYRINGLVRTTETNLSNMEKMAAAGGSMISYDLGTGKFAAVVNKLVAKTLDFDDSNILGGIALNSTDLTAAYNKVEVQFPYKVLKDQYNYVRFDLPEIYRNANEPDNTMQITHEFVNDPVQATILANLDLRQSREDQSITFKTDYSKYNVAIGAVIGVTNSVYGWVGRQFKVIRIRRNESDSGQLTIEVTAQAYNPDVFTVEDISDFVPLIGVGHSLPALTAIQRPLAPTVTSSTLSSQPSVSITGIIPEGLVTLLEFWQTTDTGADTDAIPYTLIGSMRPENGGLFTIGDAVTFRTVELRTGTYRFKVRASYNGTSTSKFSPPSASLAYTYVQAPDVLKYTTPITDANGADTAAGLDGLNLPLLLGYAALKMFGGNVLASLGEALGMTPEQIAKITGPVNAEQAAINAATTTANTAVASAANSYKFATAGGKTLSAVKSNNLKFVAGTNITIDGDDNTNTVTINSTASGTGTTSKTAMTNVKEVSETIITNTVTGKVFPCLFGSGPTPGEVDSRAGIFTHDHMVWGGSAAADKLELYHQIDRAKELTVSINGKIQNFYNFPSLSTGNWSQKPFYDESLTDRFEANTSLTLYYATATYTSGNLDQQSWSNWKRLGSDNGVTGNPTIVGNTIVTTNTWWSNPPVVVTDVPYIIEDIEPINGVIELGGVPNAITNKSPNFVLPADTEKTAAIKKTVDDPDNPLDPKTLQVTGGELLAYDPFKPNVLVTQTTTTPLSQVAAQLDKSLEISLTKNGPNTIKVNFNGGPNDLIIFGTSVFNLPDNTPFNNNTVFGHMSAHYQKTYPHAQAFKQIANNGSVFVGIDVSTNKVFYSTDGKAWNRIKVDSTIIDQYLPEVPLGKVTAKQDELVNNLNGYYHLTKFDFVTYNGSKFFAYGNFYDADPTEAIVWHQIVATSTDGKNWIEELCTDVGGLIYADQHKHIIASPSLHLALKPTGGFSKSVDGINWTKVLTLPSSLNGVQLITGCWDGTKFIVNGSYSNGVGSVMYSSTDLVTWSPLNTNINEPTNSQKVSSAENSTALWEKRYRNDSNRVALP